LVTSQEIMVSSQTPHFGRPLSFFSLFFLLHCQGNGLSSASGKVAGKCQVRTQHSPRNRHFLQVVLQRQCLSAQCALPQGLGLSENR
jgi:hypothetical protein